MLGSRSSELEESFHRVESAVAAKRKTSSKTKTSKTKIPKKKPSTKKKRP